MKVILAARISFVAFALAMGVTVLYARTGLRVVGVLLPRQVWLAENTALWTANWWLWLAAIFTWMLVLAACMYAYLPGHRLASMLQSGLTVIAAVLCISGVIIWMNALPWAAGRAMANELVNLVDTLALTFIGAGFFMVGVATAWICSDLMRVDAMPRWLPLPGLLAGLALLPTPFLLPDPLPVAVGLLLWLVWCAVLSLRRALPSAYAEWK
jgi:hypothetical protein